MQSFKQFLEKKPPKPSKEDLSLAKQASYNDEDDVIVTYNPKNNEIFVVTKGTGHFDDYALATFRRGKLVTEAFKWPSKIAKNFRLTPLSIDEWWGIEIDFNWKQKDFYKKWLKSTGGDQKAEIELMEKVAAEAKKSPQWKAFMKKFNKISVDRSSIDNSQVTQYIPNFNPRDFDDWNFNDVGGNISATTRDE